MLAPTRSIFAGALVIIALSTAGCDSILGHDLNRKFCRAHTDDPDCRRTYPDAGPDGPTACTTDQQCSGTTPVCDLETGGSKTCVECTVAEHGLCTGATPACIDNKCEKCTAHTQCDASNVCLPDGTCADAGQVAYVQGGGTGALPCTKDAPCGTLDAGVKAAKPTIKMSGMVSDSKTTVIDGQAVTIVSDPGAKLSRTTPGIILQVQNDRANVGVYDLEITLGTGMSNPAVSMPVGGSPNLSLTRVVIDGNQGVGVSAAGGSLTITQSTVSSNTGGGISTTGGSLTVAQSSVSGNPGGGISVSGAQYDVTNTFVLGNGSGTTTLGGVLLSNITTAGTHRFEFNTLATNTGGQDIDTGISCSGILVPLVFSNSIVYGNAVLGAGRQIGGSANCSVTYSDVGPTTVSGVGNINADPKFVNGAGGNYHLQAGSPAENVADPAATLSVDFDGDTRPQGGRSDMGADEVKQ